jgi:hypothetical protein
MRRVREVEDATAARMEDLERRTVDSAAALEDLLARMGEVARASSALTRGAADPGDPRGRPGGPPRR